MKKQTIYIILTFTFVTFIIFLMKKSPTAIIGSLAHDKTKSFSVLTANVGNLNLGCQSVLNKLCYKDVEDRIASNIQTLNPDVIALQEVLAPWQCENLVEKNKKKVCFESQSIPQVRRLVGDDYSIVCNTRNQFECIAVRADVGEIIGCKKGAICNTARTALEISGCDNGFTISAASIKLNNGVVFDIVNFHPQSTDPICRAKMILLAVDGNETTPPLIKEDKVILLGDFNLDPWRGNDESTIAWKKIIDRGWGGKDFNYHSGIAEKNPPYFTSLLLYRKRTLDLIVSNFAQGVCNVMGESPNTSRLDGGKGTDHRALFGILTIEP